jgi:transposase
MREDMREVYRERGAARAAPSGARPERPRQLSPQEREKLRQDVQNANRDLRR